MIPKEISSLLRQFREQVLELSQAQFAALLGMGVASINRIENGAEPTPAHKLLLESIQEPNNLIRALDGKETVLGKATIARLSRIAERLLRQNELEKIALYQSLKWSKETAGRESFELDKLVEMVKYFAAKGEWKTKLNKLLFYSDFLAYKELGKSITGTRYVIGSFGPIPDRQDALFSALTEAGKLEAREGFVGMNSEPVEKFYTRGELDRRCFKKAELSILERVRRFFLNMTAKQVADYSHEESFYIEGQLGEAIPYKESKKIREIPIHTEDSAPSSTESPSLGELAAKISSQVPMSEWEKLPADGSKNIDAYLYGAKKQK